MESIALNLNRLQETKVAIKEAIINKGQTILDTDPFYLYASKIAAIDCGDDEIVNLNILDPSDNQITNAIVEVYYWDHLVCTYAYKGQQIKIGIPELVSYTFKITGTSYIFNVPSYTAVKGYERSINLNGLPSGVFIYGIDGKFYGPSEWTKPNSESVGVAVINVKSNFVISKAVSVQKTWGGYGKKVSDITTTTNQGTAVKDFNGEYNTDKIISQLEGYNDGYSKGAPAAEYCRSITFPHGKKGYLGSLGQWKVVYSKKAAINTCMAKCGGQAIPTDNYHWTSTQRSSDSAWILRWSDGNVNTAYKYDTNHYARAFSAL